MGMIDLYNTEQAAEALDDAVATREEFLKQIEELDTIIFILKYFLATGDPLDPAVFGIEDPEEEVDD
jgi:hypothetical protein